MTEWLTQYERVAQRQQQYLQKIRDLRHRLQTKDERHMMLSIERLRNTPAQHAEAAHSPAPLPHHKNPDYKSHVPWSSSLLAHSFYPKASCPTPRLMAEKPVAEVFSPDRSGGGGGGGSSSSYQACVIAGERLLPRRQHPKHLNPLSPRQGKAERAAEMTLERNKTDYEPIESIAKRNRIQFSGYLTSGDNDKDRDEREIKAVENSGFGNAGGRRQKDLCDLSVVANHGDVLQRDV